MIAIQLPAAAPHVLYTNIPATTRRAANLPFLVGVRTSPPQTQTQTSTSSAPRATRRAPPPPRRRNAISYHSSHNENPFADPVIRPARAASTPTWSEPSPKRTLSPPVEPHTLRKATLISSGHMTDVAEPLRFSPPPMSAPAREQTCRLVASLLLNRSSRSRPMCGRTRRCAPGRSRLATCVILEDAA